jgi:hypothetical protein
MDRCVRFEKDGLWFYDDEGKRTRPKEEVIFARLNETCEIADDTTLLDIFHAVDHYELLKLFISQFSWCLSIEEFHKAAEEPFIPPLTDENWQDDLEYMEVYRTFDLHAKYVNNHCGFHAVGKFNEEENSREHYSTSASPINEYCNIPVRLNNAVTIFKGYKREVIWQGQYNYTVLDVLDAIYDDISFYGGPEDNKAFLEDMKGRMEGVQEWIDGDRKDPEKYGIAPFPLDPPEDEEEINPELN